MIRRALLAAAASTFVLVPGAVGTPSWGAPSQLSTRDRALAPELALNPVGDALVVWDDEIGAECPTEPAALSCIHVVQAAARDSGSTTWRSPVELSRPGVDSRPTAGMGGSGDAAVAWVHDIGRDRVLQATYHRGRFGTWPEPNDLSEPSLQIRNHAIALDDAGNVVAVWAERADASFAVKAAVRSVASGVWGAPVTLSSSSTASAGPDLAVSPAGVAIVAWVERGSVVRVADGDLARSSWQPAVEVSRSPNPVRGDPKVALAAGGARAVTWVQQAPGQARDRVQVAYGPGPASWEPPHGIPNLRPESVTFPVVGTDGDGDLVVAWISGSGIHAAARLVSTGTWTPPTPLTVGGPRATELELAVDPAGNSAALWSTDGGSLRSAIRPGSSGTWQPPLDVASSDSIEPRVAMDADGDGVAVWNASSGTRVTVLSAPLDGNGLVIEPVKAPRRAAPGTPVTFTTTSAPWASPLTGPLRWRFGDGASATGRRVVYAYARFGRYVVSVTQADAAGGTSTRRATVVVGAPRKIVRPFISGGVRSGSLLTCTPGTWAGARPITFAFQWLRDGFAIPCAAVPRYRVRVRDLGEVLGCRVRATNRLASTAALARPVRA